MKKENNMPYLAPDAKLKPVRRSWVPTKQCIRFKSKVNIKHPKPPHFLRASMLEVCKPIYPRDERPQQFRCTLSQEKIPEPEPHPFDLLLAKELQKTLSVARIVTIFHLNAITNNEFFELRKQFYFKQMILLKPKATVLRYALQGTTYAPLEQLVLPDPMNCIVTSKEANLTKLLKLQQKMPQLTLLAGFFDGHLLSKRGIEEASRLPSLDILRASVCATLSAAAQHMLRNVNHPAQHLSVLLQQHSKSADEPSDEASKT